MVVWYSDGAHKFIINNNIILWNIYIYISVYNFFNTFLITKLYIRQYQYEALQ